MVSYLHLIYTIKLKNKITNIGNFIKPLNKIDRKFVLFIFMIISIFKCLSSIVTILALEDIFLALNISNLVPYILLILLYAYSKEDVEKTDSFLKKLQWTYLVSPISKSKISFYFWVIPSILNLLFKLDVILPFIVYLVYKSNFFGFLGVFCSLFFALLQNISQLSTVLSQKGVEKSFLRIIVSRFLMLMVGFYFADKIVDLVTWAIEVIKSLLKGADYHSVNLQLEQDVKRIFENVFSEVATDIDKYIALAVLFFLFVTLNDIWNIQKNARFMYLAQGISTDRGSSNYLRKKLTLSFIESIYFNQLEKISNLPLFLIDNTEIYIAYYVIYRIGRNTTNAFSLMYIFIAFFIVLNSNIVHSLVIKNQNSFRNYEDINRMSYWRLSNYDIVDLYRIKRSLLSKLAFPLVIEQLFISYIVSLLASTGNRDFYFYMTVLHLILFTLSKPLINLHSRLSLFMVPYIFSKYYRSIKRSGTSEFEYFIYEKMYNFYKLPLVLLTLIPLGVQLFFDFFNFWIVVALVGGFIIYYNYILRETELFIEKGKREYEKICV